MVFLTSFIQYSVATDRPVQHILMAEALITAAKCFVPKSKEEEEEIERIYNSYRNIIATLPKNRGWATQHLCQYQGFWFQPMVGLEGIMWMQQHFISRPTDVYLISSPKSVSMSVFPSRILTFSRTTPIADPEVLPSPRIFATHTPFTLLPDSIQKSSCPIVYICRNPKDVLVSLCQFVMKVKPKDLLPLSLEDAFEMFCEGISPCGSYWDHVLGYWKASLEFPSKILFLKYEDMKEEPLLNIKRVAEFVGRPFSLEEEENGTVQEILKLRSFEKMKNLEVNKNGFYPVRNTKNDVFFREGKVRELENHPNFNAGRGSVLTTKGTVEIEACIMDGKTKRCGAVSGLTTVINPISLARLVMEKTPHIYLAFDGAEDFARE
ncbi:hypothetical protein Patl1_18946 [Pistacia atlantica]|uniref:Uncharacterized protein n=1 Tax=Pistacia atlantica TaxID=434234 RepID=A0ACC1BXM6_9ROSI|nr:hypothetical protein Patl1_18946 [Pistacia atlantica]